MLDPWTFTYAGVLYTVKRLYVTDLGPFDSVAFETSPALPNDAGLVLRVPTFKTDDVFGGGCPMAVEYQDFEIYSPDASNPGVFSWPVSFIACLTSVLSHKYAQIDVRACRRSTPPSRPR